MILGTKAFAGIIDHCQAMTRGNLAQLVPGRRVPKDIHRHDGLRAWGDLPLEIGGIEIVGFRLHVDKDRDCPLVENGIDAGREGERRNEHLVAVAYAQPAH